MQQTGLKPTKVYLLYKDSDVFRIYLNKQKAHLEGEKYFNEDKDQQYTWSMVARTVEDNLDEL